MSAPCVYEKGHARRSVLFTQLYAKPPIVRHGDRQMTYGLTDADRERLGDILSAHRAQAVSDGTTTIPYADRPRVQARVLWAMRDVRSPCKAGPIAADPRVSVRAREVGKCLSTLAEQGVVERVRYSNGSWWWRVVE